MRKNLIYAGMLLLSLTVATSCSNEESLEQVLNNGNVIEAVIENATEARTSVNDNYEVIWTENDAFNVFENGVKKATLTLSDGQGTTSGKFMIDNDVTITEEMVALFPASESLSYTFAESYTSQETDAPMSATFASGKFTFNLLTAMVRVVVADVPAGDVSMTISSNDLFLTGEAALSDGALSVPTTGNKSVSVNFTTTEAGTLTFDVPVPVQNYTNGLSVVVKSGDTEVLNKTTNAFDAEAGKLYLFGATYVTAENAATSLQSALEACEEGDVVVLTGDVEEVNVPSLTLAAETTATLDLNGKTLVLGESASTMALGRAASAAGIENNGTLTLSNGSIEFQGGSTSIAIYNKGVLNLTNVDVKSDGFCIKQAGTWIENQTLENQGDITVITTIEGGVITSTTSHTTTTGTHTYALYGIDNSKFIVKDATVNGEGAIAVSCAHVELTNVTSIASCTSSAYNLYLEAAATAIVSGCNFTANSGVKVYAYDNWNATYGTIKYNDEVKTTGVISSTSSALTALQAAFANGGEYTLSENVTLTEALSLPTEKTLILNLGTSKITGQIVNNGNLTIKGGTIAYEGGSASGIAITNKSVLKLEGTNVESDGFCIKQAGTWTDGQTLENQGNITVTTTIEGGVITSTTSHTTGTHTYALYGIDNSKFIVKDATVNGDGAIAVSCAHVELTNVTSNATCNSSAYNLYLEAAATATVTDCNFTANSGINVFAYDKWHTYGAIKYNNETVNMANGSVVIDRQN